MSRTYAIQAGALRENPNSGPDGVGVQADIAYTLEARAEVQAVCGVATGAPAPAANDNAPVATATGGLRFLSVCSGIEAASVAWHPLGWRAVAFSEIEKFPSAVLAHHYPDVPNLGDFTAIDTTKLGQVDILAGGTPCQAFSVAGLRQGLDDARGNLTLKFVELAHELADGNGLRNVVWENVVGVLSDKGNAFGCFLAGLVGADSAVVPGEKPADGQSNKLWRWSRADGIHVPIWSRHGMVAGPKGRAAWAVKDGQFFGVAQRRRRVLLVADFGNGADPAAVLFEPESLPRHPPARGEAGQSPTHTVAPSLVSSGRGVERTGDTRGQDPVVACYAPEIARCVATREGSSQDYESTTMVAVSTLDGHGVARTLSARHDGSPCADRGPNIVAVAFNAEAQADQLPGVGRDTDVNDGLTVSQRAAVAITGSVAFVQNSRDEVRLMGGDGSIVGALAAEPGAKQQCYLAQTVAIRGRDGGATAELGGEVATALRASQGGGDKPHVLYAPETYSTLSASEGGTMTQIMPIVTSAVRRLTPMECERLQGFPDSYTRIPLRAYSTKQVTKNRPDDMWEFIDGKWWLMSADGPRYKALGNSWAVPKFVWLGKRISALMPNEKPAAGNDNDGVRDEVA